MFTIVNNSDLSLWPILNGKYCDKIHINQKYSCLMQHKTLFFMQKLIKHANICASDLENFFSHLVAFLVKTGRHLQQAAALVQGCSKGFPLLLQLA